MIRQNIRFSKIELNDLHISCELDMLAVHNENDFGLLVMPSYYF